MCEVECRGRDCAELCARLVVVMGRGSEAVREVVSRTRDGDIVERAERLHGQVSPWGEVDTQNEAKDAVTPAFAST